MGLSAEAYARQLRGLLPRGSIWPRELDSTLRKLLLAIGDELARVEGRGEDVLREAVPTTALETLEDWERVFGLPDECVEEIPETVNERRFAILGKLVATGGASRAYFIDLAAALGFTITISEYTVARVGIFRSGDRLYGEAWAYAWLVNADLSSPALEGWSGQSVLFRSGLGRSGDRLASWNGPALECFFRRSAPAHTVVLFEYS